MQYRGGGGTVLWKYSIKFRYFFERGLPIVRLTSCDIELAITPKTPTLYWKELMFEMGWYWRIIVWWVKHTAANLPWHRIGHYAQPNTLPPVPKTSFRKSLKNFTAYFYICQISSENGLDNWDWFSFSAEEPQTDTDFWHTKSCESMIYIAVKKRCSVLLQNINQRRT